MQNQNQSEGAEQPESKLVSDATDGFLPKMAANKKNARSTKFALACAMLASLSSILLGYDIGVMSGASLFIKDDLKITDTQVEILQGILSLYSLVGAALAGRTSDWIGRRFTIVFAAAIFFAGALLMGFATNYAFLMVGSFVAGIGVGYALMIAPVYTAELSPPSTRGFLSSFPEVFINVGILLGYVSNYAFAGLPEHLGWRFMLGVGATPSVFLALGVIAMPESPRWLVMQGRLGEAKRVLAKTSYKPEDAESWISEIKQAVGIPEDCVDEVVVVTKRSRGENVWRDLLLRPTKSVRRILICAAGIHFFSLASGIGSVVLYGPRIFEKAGIKKKSMVLLTTVAVGFTKTIFILVATFLLDRVGRRPLLLASTGGMIFSLMGLGFGLTIVDHHPDDQVTWAIGMCIACALAFVAFYSIGLGPITWVYSSEVFPLRLRAQGMSISIAVGGVTNGVIAMTFISLYKAVTIGGSFFLLGGVTTVAWVFFFTYLPETRGRTLEEMESLFAGKKEDRIQLEMVTTTSGDESHGKKDHTSCQWQRLN